MAPGTPAVKLAFSTNAYLRFSFPEAARRLAAIGYAGVEIMADVPHAWPAFLLDEQKQAIRDSLKKNNLAISNINAFMMHAVNDSRQRYWHPSWIEPDVNYRRVRIDHTKRALNLTERSSDDRLLSPKTDPNLSPKGQTKQPDHKHNKLSLQI